MSKTSAGSGRKIIALLLLTVSIIMLFCPWVNIYIKENNRKFTIHDMLSYYSVFETGGSADFEEEFYDDLVDFIDEMNDEGIILDPDETYSVIELLLDSKLSPLDTARICSFTGDLLKQVKNVLEPSVNNFAASSKLEKLSQVSAAINTAAVILRLSLALAIVTFVIAFIMLICNKKLGVLPYMCISILFFGGFCALCMKANNAFSLVDENTLYYALSDFGIDAENMRPGLLHMSIFGFICAASGIAALLIAPSGRTAPVRTVTFKRTGGVADGGAKWICPNCGSAMDKDSRFCTNCGTERPKPNRCSRCGQVLDEGDAFCPGCGKPVHTKEPEKLKICPNCKHSISAVYTVCPICRHDFTAADTSETSSKTSSATSSKLTGSLLKSHGNDNAK